MLPFSLSFGQQMPAAGNPDTGDHDSLQRLEKIHIGYGNLKRTHITGSIDHVKSGGFNSGNINDPIQLIQGRVAGLAISKPGVIPTVLSMSGSGV